MLSACKKIECTKGDKIIILGHWKVYIENMNKISENDKKMEDQPDGSDSGAFIAQQIIKIYN